jgi:hypothetical protein
MLDEMGSQSGLPDLLLDAARGYPAVGVVAVVEAFVSLMQTAHALDAAKASQQSQDWGGRPALRVG